VPRDSYVDLPDHLGRTTINGAFGLAKLATAGKLRTQGVNKVQIGRDCVTVARRATRQAIEDLTGVTIDQYAEINLLSFYEISKAVAGVDVCLNKAAADENSGPDFPAGTLIERARFHTPAGQSPELGLRSGAAAADVSRVARQGGPVEGDARQPGDALGTDRRACQFRQRARGVFPPRAVRAV
jgi:anionic cell wall polymer biosynthesis LytR-Cps2A-Psr (LCP) family protein